MSSSDDEEKELMDEIQLNQSSSSSSSPLGNSNNINSSNNSNGNNNNSGVEFINQMEQVFKAIDTEENGIISLTQLRQEIESLTGDSIENNPLIGRLLNFLRIVHRMEEPKDDEEEHDDDEEDQQFEDDSSFEDLELNEKKQMEEDNTYIDFQSFLESMASYMDGSDPKKVREKQIEKLKLPKFKVPLDLLKKYNITPKYLSPMIKGTGEGQHDNYVTPLSSPTTTTTNTQSFSHLNNSPSKNGISSTNKFNRLFSTKPIVTFDQFNNLITKLNYGKEIPKQKLLMHLHDLPTDRDDCIDANLFLSRFGGLNHPMSPKLMYDGDDNGGINSSGGMAIGSFMNEKKEDQFNINSRSGNNSPPHGIQQQQQPSNSSLGTSKNNIISQWNSKNTNIVDQLQDSYKQLEREVESYQSELSMLEKQRQIQESALKKKDQEIDRLRKDARFVDGMRDANKDLMVQNQNLKNQLSKLTQNEELLRETIDDDKDKLRELSEGSVLKDLEVKKLKLLLKTQQNINNKLSMMVTFSDDTLPDNNPLSSPTGSNSNSINFTSKRIKPTIDRAKQVLGRQKSEKFDFDKYSTIHANNNFSIFLKQQQVLQQEKQDKSFSQQQHPYTSGTNSPQSLQSEFDDLNRQQQQQQSTSPSPIQQQFYQQQQQQPIHEGDEEGSELDSLKKQLSGFDYQLPNDFGTIDNYSTPASPSIDSPNLYSTTTTTSTNNNNTINNLSSPPISQLLSRVSDGPQPVQMMTPISPSIPSTHYNSNNSGNTSPLSSSTSGNKDPANRSLSSPKYIRSSSPSIKSINTPSSAPMLSTSPSSSVSAMLSPFSLNSATGATSTSNNNLNNSFNNNNSNPTTTTTTTSTSNLPNINNSNNNIYNTLGSSQLIQDQFNVGSIRRLKKSDIIRLHTSEMEEQNESAQLLITEAATALEEFKKNSALELQRLQKLYHEERQHSKLLEKQLTNQLDKNKEMVTGKTDSNSGASWGGMQNFFSFVTNYLPSTLFCNLSNTS